MIDYPKKGTHYAHKTFRIMHKAMLAAEHGRDVLCLLAVILHTEDAARYRGPVSFFNTQLMETLGFRKWEQFDAVRTKAIKSGWLQYEGCGKRSPGRYFVTIPKEFDQVDDGLMEECISPENGYKQGYDEGYRLGYDAGVKQGVKWGTDSAQTGGQTGGTSYPVPSPLPEPNPISKDSSEPSRASLVEETKTTKRKQAPDFSELELPKEIDNPQMRDAWRMWCKHRKEIKHPLTETQANAQLKEFAKVGVIKAVQGIQYTVSRGWRGIRYPEESEQLPAPRRQKTQEEKDAQLAQIRAQRAMEDAKRGA